jgi:hypothetical protein
VHLRPRAHEQCLRFENLESHMTEKPSKPVTRRTRSRKPKAEPRRPSHGEIAERAYFIHLEESGVDPLGNWLRAEAELSAAA